MQWIRQELNRSPSVAQAFAQTMHWKPVVPESLRAFGLATMSRMHLHRKRSMASIPITHQTHLVTTPLRLAQKQALQETPQQRSSVVLIWRSKPTGKCLAQSLMLGRQFGSSSQRISHMNEHLRRTLSNTTDQLPQPAILASKAAANDSFKPTPLRGAA